MLYSPEEHVFAPAKVNLFLGVTGLRRDGFHSLVSWVVQLDFGDSIHVEFCSEGSTDALLLEGSAIAGSVDENLAWKALQAFRGYVSDLPPVKIVLTKRIPVGAGLGGGSSDAVAVLKALNALSGDVLDGDTLLHIAESLGSDCPLFLERGPSIIRGRGEVVEPFSMSNWLRNGVRLLLFKPFCSVNTAWAYRLLRERRAYLSPGEAEKRLAECLGAPRSSDFSPYNSFERVVFREMPGIALVIEKLRSDGIVSAMSGSGSTCFAVIQSNEEGDHIREIIHACWGQCAFIVETSPLNEY